MQLQGTVGHHNAACKQHITLQVVQQSICCPDYYCSAWRLQGAARFHMQTILQICTAGGWGALTSYLNGAWAIRHDLCYSIGIPEADTAANISSTVFNGLLFVLTSA